MTRRRKSVPSYCRHKASGRAVARIDGVDRYGPMAVQKATKPMSASSQSGAKRADGSSCADPHAAESSFELTVAEVA